MAEEQPNIPDDRALSEPVGEEGDQAYQVLANEAGRRVFTVMQNLIEVRGRTHTDGVVGALELKAILMGAMSGIAFHVGRMQLGYIVPEGGDAPSKPVEVLMLDDLGNQYLHTIKQMRERAAAAVVEVPEGTTTQ